MASVTGVWLFRTTWQGYVRTMSLVPQLPVRGADSADRADSADVSLPGADRDSGDAVRAGVACPGHVRVGADAHRRLEFCDGASVEVLASYPVRPEADLFSLARVLVFHCADCRDPCEATIIAVREGGVLCPSCYAALGTVRDPPDHQDRTSSGESVPGTCRTEVRAGAAGEPAREPTAA